MTVQVFRFRFPVAHSPKAMPKLWIAPSLLDESAGRFTTACRNAGPVLCGHTMFAAVNHIARRARKPNNVTAPSFEFRAGSTMTWTLGVMARVLEICKR